MILENTYTLITTITHLSNLNSPKNSHALINKQVFVKLTHAKIQNPEITISRYIYKAVAYLLVLPVPYQMILAGIKPKWKASTECLGFHGFECNISIYSNRYDQDIPWHSPVIIYTHYHLFQFFTKLDLLIRF